MTTESFPGGDRIALPSPSKATFSSLPTIMNGAARARVRLRALNMLAATNTDSKYDFLFGIVASSHWDQLL
jgi:hypothetical protein